MRQILCLLALAFAATAVTTSFTATVTVTDDPSVWGVMTGTMTYKYASSATLKSTVWTLSDKTTVTEFINYTATTRYLYCSSCQAETYKNTPEQFYPLSSDVLLSSTADSKGCYKYNRSDGSSVRYVYWTGKTYSTATFCAAVYTDGKRIDFTDIVAATSPTFPNTVTWGCPAKTCNVVMDLVLVIDESTSIDSDEWANSVDFATTLVSKFNVSSSAVNVGLVYFSSDSRIVSYLDGSATNVKNTLTSTYQRGGNTCMGCGVSSAIAVFKARTTARAALNPARVMVFITDGENNRPTKWTDSDYPNTYLKQYTTELKGTYGATALAVAVGVSTSRTEFTIIASKSSYIFGVTGYDQLNSILNSLVTATCTEFPEEPCGSSCKGFCSCSTTCVCPSQCASTNKCTPQTCTTGKYWSGCQNSTLDCADTNACTVDSCLTSTGECHNENVNATTYCDDGEPCTDDYCDSTTGCYHSTHTCTTTDKCKTASCVSGKGCVYTNVTCDDGKSCTVDTCDSSSGCIYTVSCDDNNKCTNDYCATNGTCAHSDVTCTTTDLCKVPTCDKTLGCRTTTKDCEDGNVCTDNTCYPLTGCSNTSIDNCDDKVCATANCTARHNCETVRCVFDSVTQAASCVYTNKTASGGVCNSGSKCIVDSCDLTDGTCSSVSLTDKCAAANTNKCAVGSCDSSNGTCITTPVTCSAVDVCHVATCDSSTGKCVQSSYCPAAPACFDMACVILADGNPYCNKTARVCESGSKCILSTCNNETDACENSAIPQPDDGINCTDAYCDPAVGWTQIATTKCNDNDPCTVDICNASTTDRCEYQSYCNDGKYCTSDVCSADSSGNAVCTHPAITCDLNLSSSEKNCYKAVCSETQHCYKQIIRGAFTNPCGSCMTSYATSSEKNDVTCIGSLAWPQAAAAIAAGAIAGIVIAAVIGFGAFSAASAFGTWKLIQMSKAGKGLAAHNNPMYKPSDNESINPAYAQR